jgi:nicotinamidase-related amidase
MPNTKKLGSPVQNFTNTTESSTAKQSSTATKSSTAKTRIAKQPPPVKQILPNDTSSSDKMKVLIVVDVQNCFINGGSLGGQTEQYKELCTNIKNEIKSGNYDLVVFSRDFHPENHVSFINSKRKGGDFPPHCRNIKNNCNYDLMPDNIYTENDQERKQHFNGKLVENTQVLNYTNLKPIIGTNLKPIIGTNLAYHFYSDNDEKFNNILDNLNNSNGNYTIGLKEEKYNKNNSTEPSTEPSIEHIKYNIEPLLYKETKIIGLTKGEYCDYEAYSAFNYHLQNNRIPLTPQEKYSTGLWEYILITYKKKPNNINIPIIINVCGLVTNFCVKDTAKEGLKMWENVYVKKSDYENISVKFNIFEYLSLPLEQIKEYTNTNKNDLMPNPQYEPFQFPFKTPIKNNNKNYYYNFKEQKKATLMLFTSFEQTKIDIYYDEKNIVNKRYINSKLFENKGGSGHSNNCNCQSCNEYYRIKYLKYKQKYLQYKK